MQDKLLKILNLKSKSKTNFTNKIFTDFNFRDCSLLVVGSLPYL